MKMDKRINYQLIEDSFGCDNCVHEDDGYWDDYCQKCNPDHILPTKYRPVRGSIQWKVYHLKNDSITYEEYLRFIDTGK